MHANHPEIAARWEKKEAALGALLPLALKGVSAAVGGIKAAKDAKKAKAEEEELLAQQSEQQRQLQAAEEQQFSRAQLAGYNPQGTTQMYFDEGGYSPFPYEPPTKINPTLMKKYYHGGLFDAMGNDVAHPFGPIGFKRGGTLLEMVQAGNPNAYWPKTTASNLNNPGNVGTHRDNLNQTYYGSSENQFAHGGTLLEKVQAGNPEAYWPRTTVSNNNNPGNVYTHRDNLDRRYLAAGGSLMDTLQDIDYNDYQMGGAVPGGSLQPISNNAVAVHGNNPSVVDGVDIGNAMVDHGEVIKNVPGEAGQRVFSDTLKPPGSKTTFAQEAKKLEKQKHPDKPDQNSRIEQKLDELFQIQQVMNGDSQGESPGQAAAGGMQGIYQIGGEIPALPSNITAPADATRYSKNIPMVDPSMEYSMVPAESPVVNTYGQALGDVMNAAGRFFTTGTTEKPGTMVATPKKKLSGAEKYELGQSLGAYQIGGEIPSIQEFARMGESNLNAKNPQHLKELYGAQDTTDPITGEGSTYGDLTAKYFPGGSPSADLMKHFNAVNRKGEYASAEDYWRKTQFNPITKRSASDMNFANGGYYSESLREDQMRVPYRRKKGIAMGGMSLGNVLNDGVGMLGEGMGAYGTGYTAGTQFAEGDTIGGLGSILAGLGDEGTMGQISSLLGGKETMKYGGYAEGGYNPDSMLAIIIKAPEEPKGKLSDLQSKANPRGWGKNSKETSTRRESTLGGRNHRKHHDPSEKTSPSERKGPVPSHASMWKSRSGARKNKPVMKLGGYLYNNSLSKKSLIHGARA